MCIHSFCSILCWSPFGSSYSLFEYDTRQSFFFAEPQKLHQVGWKMSVHSHVQISSEEFHWIQVWALTTQGCSHDPEVNHLLSSPCASGHCPLGTQTCRRSRALWSRFRSKMSLYIAAVISLPKCFCVFFSNSFKNKQRRFFLNSQRWGLSCYLQ